MQVLRDEVPVAPLINVPDQGPIAKTVARAVAEKIASARENGLVAEALEASLGLIRQLGDAWSDARRERDVLRERVGGAAQKSLELRIECDNLEQINSQLRKTVTAYLEEMNRLRDRLKKCEPDLDEVLPTGRM